MVVNTNAFNPSALHNDRVVFAYVNGFQYTKTINKNRRITIVCFLNSLKLAIVSV